LEAVSFFQDISRESGGERGTRLQGKLLIGKESVYISREKGRKRKK